MPLRQTEERQSAAGECRQCRAFCDKLVDPGACVRIGCRFLYSYEDNPTGRRFVGCMNKVFRGEIDLDDLILADRHGGFGGIKMAGEPLPQCQFEVERAYEGDGPQYECINRRFFDYEGGGEAIRVFDLRNAIT